VCVCVKGKNCGHTINPCWDHGVSITQSGIARLGTNRNSNCTRLRTCRGPACHACTSILKACKVSASIRLWIALGERVKLPWTCQHLHLIEQHLQIGVLVMPLPSSHPRLDIVCMSVQHSRPVGVGERGHARVVYKSDGEDHFMLQVPSHTTWTADLCGEDCRHSKETIRSVTKSMTVILCLRPLFLWTRFHKERRQISFVRRVLSKFFF